MLHLVDAPWKRWTALGTIGVLTIAVWPGLRAPAPQLMRTEPVAYKLAAGDARALEAAPASVGQA